MTQRSVTLFVPCLVDQVAPEVGLATAAVLERLGCDVSYDPRQTCCGQPAYNAGHCREALQVASQLVRVLEGDGAVVCPSGSCTAMVRRFYPALFAGHAAEGAARRLGERTFEFAEFLVRDGLLDELAASVVARRDDPIGFHNSCHSYRELGLGPEPLEVLRCALGREPLLPEGEPVCCGFGGLFSVKFETIAAAMADSRLTQFMECGARTVVSNDPGCILHMRQEAAARGLDVEVVHLAELLARALGLEREAAVGSA